MPELSTQLPSSKADSTLAFVTGPSVSVWFMTSVLSIFSQGTNQRFANDLIVGYGPHIDQNRNDVVNTFLQGNRQWLFMVDNDMVFKPIDVLEVFWVADQKGPGIYAGPYLAENQVLTCSMWDEENPRLVRNMTTLPSKPMQVGAVGMGFTLIHRDVLEAAGKDPFTMKPDFDSEDVAFCYRAAYASKESYSPWIIPASSPGHFKQFILYTTGMQNVIGDEVALIET